MITTRRAAAALALATAAVLAFAGPAAADTIAVETPPVVLAQDLSPAPATVPADVVGIDANIVNGLTVTGHQGKRVTAAAKGHTTRSVVVTADRPAVLKGLTPVSGTRCASAAGPSRPRSRSPRSAARLGCGWRPPAPPAPSS